MPHAGTMQDKEEESFSVSLIGYIIESVYHLTLEHLTLIKIFIKGLLMSSSYLSLFPEPKSM